ncbi:MAG: stage V sporulation protein AD [Oscillospiraceae bacterium]|nr:stage V sporulation protein AD [Oscillospiraceae bacterium]
MGNRIGKHTVSFDNSPKILSSYSVVGPKEGEGPLSKYFDRILVDDLNGEDSFEKAETSIQKLSIDGVLNRSKLKEDDIDYLISGDLLNQLTSSHFAARDFKIPYIGVYGACSTMTESLGIGAMLFDGGFGDNIICTTSSHFSSAERQYRFPLEFGNQRKEISQWTVTGAGSFLIGKGENLPKITYVTTGSIEDYGIKDADNMGGAMAPAAALTLKRHFEETKRDPSYYDIIITGDLGYFGVEMCRDFIKDLGYNLGDNYKDCGVLIYDKETQETNSGGSGCGCSASVFTSYVYKNMLSGTINKALIMSTGALLSPTSTLQGESIPCIAHAVAIEN